jgi:hypothetical protein
MIGLPPGTKVFLACQPIDLRAGFDGLAAKVRQITEPIALTDLTTASPRTRSRRCSPPRRRYRNVPNYRARTVQLPIYKP